jgi:hypothetical protein
VKFRMVAAGTCFKHTSLDGPAACGHPTATANASKEVKEGIGDAEVGAPDSITPARNRVLTRSRTMASPTESAPADWP